MFWETWTKIVSSALRHAHHFLWNQKTSVATPQTVIQMMSLTLNFFDCCKHGFIPRCLFCTLGHQEATFVSLKSMQSLSFIIGTSLLITTSALISFYKGFSSCLRHLYGGRWFHGDLEEFGKRSCSKNVKILSIKYVFLPVTILCALQRTVGLKGTPSSAFTTILWNSLNMK